MICMDISKISKLDQKNRCHLPQGAMSIAGIEENGEVYITVVPGDNFIRVYPKSYLDEICVPSKHLKKCGFGDRE